MIEKFPTEEESKQYSPMMQTYLETKREYPDSILFYRLGDFYEMFFEDAINASRELELTLTGKLCGLEDRAAMCGIPFHAADIYISKLIEKGYKVAICEQLEDPKQAKGLVKRGVIRIVTPGTVIENNLLEEKKNNYIMSVYKESIYFGVAICDISTGEFKTTQIVEDNNFQKLLDEISRYTPAEIVVNSFMSLSGNELQTIKKRFDTTFISVSKDEYFNDKELVYENNIGDNKYSLIAVNGLLGYLEETQKSNLDQINSIEYYTSTKYMALDINARRNLELTERMRDKSKKGTLLWVLDKTSTSMGGRLLRRYINDPLIEINKINERLDAVEELKNSAMLRGNLEESLKKVYDIERLAARIAYGSANGRDLISLKNSLSQLPTIKKYLKETNSKLLKELEVKLDTLEDVYTLIDNAIVEDPPITVKEGSLIKEGYKPEIDELKKASIEGKTWLIELEAKEKEATGIKNLRLGFNKVFGYYIEVSKSNVKLVPNDRYIRKQTTVNGERYITNELKEMEDKILGAEERVINMEYDEFCKIREAIEEEVIRLQQTALVVSTVDVLVSFAKVAEEMDYCKPEVNDKDTIEIKDGRHPVIEKMLNAGEFVPNDTILNSADCTLAIITGPNMAGKSTYMRQVALITLMAQIGSFVPASYAKIGVVDKIFTRVGASDDLSMGESTFMVEMMEVASILKNVTKKSLVILDEIGRGTSTYDGLSIAWAVAEYIADKEKCGAKTLFATHYHELIDLENKLEGVRNFSVAVKEKGEDVIFLRKIVNGGTDESYGVHVARLAGVPKVVTTRADNILRSIERKNILSGKALEKANKNMVQGQLDMSNYKLAELAEEIDKIDLNSLTPIDALNILQHLKDKL